MTSISDLRNPVPHPELDDVLKAVSIKIIMIEAKEKMLDPKATTETISKAQVELAKKCGDWLVKNAECANEYASRELEEFRERGGTLLDVLKEIIDPTALNTAYEKEKMRLEFK